MAPKPESTSYSHLPAALVRDACEKALTDIAVSRQHVLQQAAKAHRVRGRFIPRRSLRAGMRRIGKQERDLAAMHRADDERVVKRLLDLARAASVDDPAFTIHVTAADFQIINQHYGDEACSGMQQRISV